MSQADMSPDASPGQTKKTGVRRVNNMPMFIGAGALLAFMAVMMMVAADRAAQQNAEAEATSERAGSTSMFAHEIAGDLTDGIVAAEKLEVPPAEELEVEPTAPIETAAAPLLVEPTNFNVPPTPPSHFEPQMQDDEADRIRMAKLQMLEEAARAKTSVQVSAPRSSGSSLRGAPHSREDALAQIAAARQQIESTRTSDPTAAYQARLNQVRNQMGGNSFAATGGFDDDGPSLLQVSTSSSQRNSLDQFKSGEDDRWSLDSKPEAPRSPYELRAGFTVPATLVSGINSDLPGQIMAQVSQNVYDTATGRHLLIPQGSRLVGSYSSDVAYGQNRVMVGWQRIVFPDGKAMDIGAMPGSDVSGYSGFKDKVNNHYFRLFGSAFLMSGVTAGITLSQDNNNNSGDRQRASDAMSEALGQQLGQVTAQLIARNMNISPTIEIRPGFRFNVIVTKDMTFSKPYRSFDY